MATTTRYWKKKLLLSKIETTGGQDAAPTPALNAVEMRNAQFTPLDAQYVENNVEAGYFGNAPEIAVSQAARLQFDVAIQGSGTAGVPPAFGHLLRGGANAEISIASALTGTAQAGSISTIRLAAGASATDNAYKGMRIRTTGGTGANQAAYVLSYNGTTKDATIFPAFATAPDATTTYSIDAQTVYCPVSAGMESLTHYMYMDGLLHKLLFARNSIQLKLTPKNLAVLSFDVLAMYTAPTDVAVPSGAVLTGYKTPLPVLNAWSSGFQLLGYSSPMYDLSLNLGQKVIHRDDVIGVDDTQITDRAPTGATSIQAPLLAEKNYFVPALAATTGELLFTHGTAAGSRFRIACPASQVKSPKNNNKDGILTLGMDLRLNPVNGNDDYFLIFD